MRKKRTRMTTHAREQMETRGVRLSAIDAAFRYGRVAPRPGQAIVYAIGRKEIAEARNDGVDLSKFNGIQIVVTTEPGREAEIITVYRNTDLASIRGRRKFRQAR